ncbi:MAG TPA: hypothetical protein VGF45_19585 [Polyangia bacterium]
MSHYTNECDEVGAFVISPSAIKHEIETVESAARQLDGEVRSSAVAPEFTRAWTTFLGEWRRFFEGHQRWVDLLFDSTYFKALEFRRRMGSWRDAFIKAGGRPLAPGLPGDSLTFPWERLALVAGGAIATLGVMNVVAAVLGALEDRR